MNTDKLPLLVLALTIPVTILAVLNARVITGVPITPEGAKLAETVILSLITGVVSLLSYKYGKNDKQ